MLGERCCRHKILQCKKLQQPFLLEQYKNKTVQDEEILLYKQQEHFEMNKGQLGTLGVQHLHLGVVQM